MATKPKHRVRMVCALMVVAAVTDGVSAWAETIDREPVRATFVRRFSVPVVSDVLGPEIGGRSYARAIDVFDDNFSIYASGFWWTRAAGGQRWTLMSGQPPSYASWRLVAPDPARPDTVYRAVGQEIFRSEDAGATWKRRGLSPCDSEQILVTKTGLLLVVGEAEVCRSADGGFSWETAAHEVIGLALAPGNHRIVYAFSAIQILRSSNGARSFIDVSPGHRAGASALAVAPSDANVVYALAWAPSEGSFLRRTENGGVSWTELFPPVSGLDWSAPAVDPTAARHLVILGGPKNEAASRRLFESFDGGDSWIAHAGSVKATALRLSATTKGLEIEAFGRRGIFKTLDRGDSWVSADQGIAADSYLDLAAAGNGDLYLLEKESGGVWRSQDGGLTWELRGLRPGIDSRPEAESIAVDPFEPTKLVTFNEGLPDIWWSDDGGRTWSPRESPKPQGEPLTVFSLAFDPHRRDTIYAGTLRDAWSSADRGVTWRRLTRSLPTDIECSDATGSCTHYRDVESVVPDPLVPGRLFIDYATGSFRSEDAGATWKRLTRHSNLIRPDPRIKDRLYLGYSSYTTVLQSDRAGASPWRTLLREPETYAQYLSDWLTFDPYGRLVVAPAENVATFLRRLGTSKWERFSVALRYEDGVRLLEPIVATPGGGARMFLVAPGLGLFRADLPPPLEP